VAISFLDQDPHGVSFAEVEAFLLAGYGESERLEYKSRIVDDIANTLVAMANMDGGLIVCGVDADKNGKPQTWNGLDQNDPLGILANQDSAYCVPHVRYRAEVVTKPSTGKPLVIVQVSESLRKPHMTRQRGILVRVGDQERPADLELTRRWFLDAERQQVDADKRFARPLLVPSSVGINVGGAVCLVVYARSLTRTLPLQPTEETDRSIRELLAKHLHAAWHLSPSSRASVESGWLLTSRSRGFVEFYNSDRRLYARVASDGVSEVTAHWPQPTPGVNPSVDLIDFISTLHRVLCFQLKLLREVFAYADDLRVRVQVLNVNGAQFLGPVVGQNLTFFGQVPSAVEYDLTLTSETGVASETRSTLLAVFRDAQVDNYETNVDSLLVIANTRGQLPPCN
jgi:hypothetical protein